MNKINKWFTLVELIVVVTILWILSTIWFVAYSGYLVWVRDTNRVSNMKALSDGLELYRTKNTLPLPDDYVEVKANWKIIWYQWYAWKNVIESIEFSSEWVDPKDKIYYSYYLTKDRRYYQLMWFLEEKSDLELAGNFTEKVNAIDYSIRYPTVYGKNLWILTDNENTPIQEVPSIKSAWEIDLGSTNSGTVYNAHIDNLTEYSFSWKILNNILYSLSKPWIYWAPKWCPDGFIWVPWDSEFRQRWFCLSAYEMSYDANDPLVLAWTWWLTQKNTDWNVYDYIAWKKIASRRGWYPIAYITQPQAIDACKSMWPWFHLQTESEWMSLSRDVEITKINWSWWKVWEWFITNWNSNDSKHWCSIDLSNSSDPEYTWRRRAAPVWFKANNTCNETRKYVLSNWAYVRDIGWNLREHVNKANNIDGEWYNEWILSVWTSTGTVQWNDWTNTSTWVQQHWPLFWINASLNWIWTVQRPAWVSNNVVVRWGCAYCGSNDWLYWVELNYTKTFRANNYWFRCAYIDEK